jgi:hypothetical protein
VKKGDVVYLRAVVVQPPRRGIQGCVRLIAGGKPVEVGVAEKLIGDDWKRIELWVPKDVIVDPTPRQGEGDAATQHTDR